MAHRLNIQNLREAAASLGDHTNYAIAKRARVSQSTISRLFSGDCQPRGRTLDQFLRVYPLRINELMTDDEEEQVAA